jgi:hypothetical protein
MPVATGLLVGSPADDVMARKLKQQEYRRQLDESAPRPLNGGLPPAKNLPADSGSRRQEVQETEAWRARNDPTYQRSVNTGPKMASNHSDQPMTSINSQYYQSPSKYPPSATGPDQAPPPHGNWMPSRGPLSETEAKASNARAFREALDQQAEQKRLQKEAEKLKIRQEDEKYIAEANANSKMIENEKRQAADAKKQMELRELEASQARQNEEMQRRKAKNNQQSQPYEHSEPVHPEARHGDLPNVGSQRAAVNHKQQPGMNSFPQYPESGPPPQEDPRYHDKQVSSQLGRPRWGPEFHENGQQFQPYGENNRISVMPQDDRSQQRAHLDSVSRQPVGYEDPASMSRPGGYSQMPSQQIALPGRSPQHQIHDGSQASQPQLGSPTARSRFHNDVYKSDILSAPAAENWKPSLGHMDSRAQNNKESQVAWKQLLDQQAEEARQRKEKEKLDAAEYDKKLESQHNSVRNAQDEEKRRQTDAQRQREVEEMQEQQKREYERQLAKKGNRRSNVDEGVYHNDAVHAGGQRNDNHSQRQQMQGVRNDHDPNIDRRQPFHNGQHFNEAPQVRYEDQSRNNSFSENEYRNYPAQEPDQRPWPQEQRQPPQRQPYNQAPSQNQDGYYGNVGADSRDEYARFEERFRQERASQMPSHNSNSNAVGEPNAGPASPNAARLRFRSDIYGSEVLPRGQDATNNSSSAQVNWKPSAGFLDSRAAQAKNAQAAFKQALDQQALELKARKEREKKEEEEAEKKVLMQQEQLRLAIENDKRRESEARKQREVEDMKAAQAKQEAESHGRRGKGKLRQQEDEEVNSPEARRRMGNSVGCSPNLFTIERLQNQAPDMYEKYYVDNTSSSYQGSLDPRQGDHSPPQRQRDQRQYQRNQGHHQGSLIQDEPNQSFRGEASNNSSNYENSSYQSRPRRSLEDMTSELLQRGSIDGGRYVANQQLGEAGGVEDNIESFLSHWQSQHSDTGGVDSMSQLLRPPPRPSRNAAGLRKSSDSDGQRTSNRRGPYGTTILEEDESAMDSSVNISVQRGGYQEDMNEVSMVSDSRLVPIRPPVPSNPRSHGFSAGGGGGDTYMDAHGLLADLGQRVDNTTPLSRYNSRSALGNNLVEQSMQSESLLIQIGPNSRPNVSS